MHRVRGHPHAVARRDGPDETVGADGHDAADGVDELVARVQVRRDLRAGRVGTRQRRDGAWHPVRGLRRSTGAAQGLAGKAWRFWTHFWRSRILRAQLNRR